MSSIESLYHSLLDNGELANMFPNFKGEWAKDKKLFTTYYEENQKILNDDYLDLDADDGFSDSDDF